MHFHKQPSPFSLARLVNLKRDSAGESTSSGIACLQNAECTITARALDDGIFELTIDRAPNSTTTTNHTPALACAPHPARNVHLSEDEGGRIIRMMTNEGAALQIRIDPFAIGLSVEPKATGGKPVNLIPLDETQRIGFNGKKFGFGLRMPDDTPYYGFGEKTGSLNKHGSRMKFWNVDVCADLPDGCQTAHYDPTYCSIPVAIWNASNDNGDTAYAAVFVDNSGPSWFNCQTNDFGEPDLLYFGTYLGVPRFYFITGSSMADVCAKILKMTGTPKMPPLWSFANQQCRWGYDEERMYKRIILEYEEEKIPLHGFWLDIDYMNEYQVFTWHKDRVPSPKELSEWMNERSVHMVTIVDPGVPTREDNQTYLEGRERDFFCHAPSGELFVGMVWPGKTAFPDYSMPEVREWWGALIAEHLGKGIDGIWNDMNDPATGMSDVDDMLFNHGQIEHAHFHNYYGTFMAEATWLGFRKHEPSIRPFILTRSASTGIQKYAAVWTGDNISSWTHLKMSIPETLNLALSGVSFNGADIGGFMESTTAELMTRWYQAAVLFPFYRNHSNNGTAHQEPWCFGSTTRNIIRDAIVLRYRFLAHLYTEFAHHIETGEPLIRPVCYFSADPVYRDVADEYSLGNNVIVAPVVEPGARRRYVVLPPGDWFDLTHRTWHVGGEIFERECEFDDVPIYVRDKTIIAEPVPPSGSFVGWDCNLENTDWRIHVYSRSGRGVNVSHAVAIDDGLTYTDETPSAREIGFVVDTNNDAQLAGSFPFERVIEITMNGSEASTIETMAEPASNRSWNLVKGETPLASVLRPMPVNRVFKNQCRVYRRSKS